MKRQLYTKVKCITASEIAGSETQYTVTDGRTTRKIAAISQPLSKRSKTYGTVADPGSTSGGTFQSMQFFAVFIYFFIPVLSRSSFTSRTPNKDQKIKQLFYFLLVQVP